MITYKEWKSLNESFGGAIPIGVGTPSVVGGIMGSKLGLDEAKKGKKKMFGDEEVPEEDEKEKDEKPKDDDKEEGDDDKEEGDDEEDGDDEEAGEDKKAAFFMSKKKSNKKSKKNMTKEWHDSVKSQLGSDPNQKSWDGFSTLEEDAVIPPADPNAELVDNQPGPGEVGYSPSTRLGGWFSNY